MPVTSDKKLRELLADGCISAISIDTNIFDEKGNDFRSPALQSIAGLKRRDFKFIMSSTVVKEIIRHLESNANDALREARKSIGTALRVFETKAPTRDDLIREITGGKSPEQMAIERFKSYQEATACEMLDDVRLVDTETIYSAYFKASPPFGGLKKKSEFPDALALNALERISEERDIEILIVSKDQDWRSFCENSRRLHLVTDLERALSLINAPDVRLGEAIRSWMQNIRTGRAALQRKLIVEIEKMDLSVTGTPSFGEMEATAWGPQLQNIAWPKTREINVIEIRERMENRYEALVSFPIRAMIEFTVDASFYFRDQNSNDNYPMSVRKFDSIREVDMRITASIDLKFDEFGDLELTVDWIDADQSILEFKLGIVDAFVPQEEAES